MLAERCVFTGGTEGAIEVGSHAIATVLNSDILNAGGPSLEVKTQVQVSPTLNFEDNFWGTTDSTQIADWIIDGNDPEHAGTRAVVDFLPFRVQSVANQKTTFGRIKAGY